MWTLPIKYETKVWKNRSIWHNPEFIMSGFSLGAISSHMAPDTFKLWEVNGPSASQMSFYLTWPCYSTFLFLHSVGKLVAVCFGWSAQLNICVISWQQNTSAPAAHLGGGFVCCACVFKTRSQNYDALRNRTIIAYKFPFLKLTNFLSKQLQSSFHGRVDTQVLCTCAKTAEAAAIHMCPLKPPCVDSWQPLLFVGCTLPLSHRRHSACRLRGLWQTWKSEKEEK